MRTDPVYIPPRWRAPERVVWDAEAGAFRILPAETSGRVRRRRSGRRSHELSLGTRLAEAMASFLGKSSGAAR